MLALDLVTRTRGYMREKCLEPTKFSHFYYQKPGGEKKKNMKSTVMKTWGQQRILEAEEIDVTKENIHVNSTDFVGSDDDVVLEHIIRNVSQKSCPCTSKNREIEPKKNNMPQCQPTPDDKGYFCEPRKIPFPLRLLWINTNEASHIGVDLNRPPLDENVSSNGPPMNLDLNIAFLESQPSPTPPPSISQPSPTPPPSASQPNHTFVSLEVLIVHDLREKSVAITEQES
ncbi:hypothetical protein Cgig2_016436 [Carnegiea gigantea]|uniref:Uncharacterized protein n=1 Tax=Carnegiea gigantea TaxID=171969 RepID=A0A9Q1QCH7_9CARY|nr:hypothetical protein Cgig2_016436 [Carnegiea gigantea]